MIEALPRKLFILTLISIVVSAYFVTSAIAAKKPVLPGWGLGDTASVHTGPPGGPSVHPIHQTNNTNNNFNFSVSNSTGGNSVQNGNLTTGNSNVNININSSGGSNIVN